MRLLGKVISSPFLSIQLGMLKIVPDVNLIDRNLAMKAKESFLRRVNAVPAFEKDGVMTLIMADPLSQSTINDFKILFRCQIEPAVATRSAKPSWLTRLRMKFAISRETLHSSFR